MMIIIFLGKLMCDVVSFMYAGDQNYKLGVLKSMNGVKVLRLLDTEHRSSFKVDDKFTVDDGPTSIYASEGHICVDPFNLSVQICLAPDRKSIFTFEKAGEHIIIKTEDNKCVSKTDLDPETNGFFLKLRTCGPTYDQKFIKTQIMKTATSDQKYSYNRLNLDPLESDLVFESPNHEVSEGFKLTKQSKYFPKKEIK